MNPLLPIITFLLAVIIALGCYIAHLLDQWEQYHGDFDEN
jgi:hypothetical protein